MGGYEMHNELNVRIHMEDGAFWATVDQFPGVFATGDNLEELRESLEEGIGLVVASPDGPITSVKLGELRLSPVETEARSTLVPA